MSKTKTLNLDVTLSLVARVRDSKPPVNIEEFLKKNTEWLAEPKNADGCVIALSYKSHVEKKSRVREDS